MCGIFLYFQPTQKTEFAIVAAEFEKTRHRGPDNSSLKMIKCPRGILYIGFHRLAIMDPTENGDQPFEYRDATCICNGEIYNYKEISTCLEIEMNNLYTCKSKSDCEVILPLYHHRGIEQTCNILDGEFAFIIYDHAKNLILAGTDHLRTRPLFIGYGKNGEIAMASEVKSIQSLPHIVEVKPFPPGCWWSSDTPFIFSRYTIPFNEIPMQMPSKSIGDITRDIVHLFTRAVQKRMSADQDIGFFLSGGLDSSLCTIVAAQQSVKPIMTFTASFSKTGPDLLAAREVAKSIGSNHREVIFSIEEGIAAIPRTIKALESYCCTTVRASVPQLLLCEWVQKHYPNIKVMISGENSDETFCGYEYFKYAPTTEASHLESAKLLEAVHLYDALRADRTVASVGMELRVPFTERALVEYVLSLDHSIVRAPTPDQMKANGGPSSAVIEKKLLRDAFKNIGLPEAVLYRSKMGLSDSCGLNWVDQLKKHANETISDREFNLRYLSFPQDPPRTKEEFLYRRYFEEYITCPNKTNLIKSHWMPNPDWFDTPLTDPSARMIGTFVGK